MKKIQKKLKRGMAVLLVFALATGIVPVIPGSADTVLAAASNVPSVTAFSTTNDLMTAFDLDGNNDTVGKLAFGKHTASTAQEWYIAGKDSGVAGDNIIIFAAAPIGWERPFGASEGEIILKDIEGTDPRHSLINDWTYPNGISVTTVNANHYGISNLRAQLKAMEANTKYFTAAEQGLMNATTVTTKDTYNHADYTTTDKLYALGGTYWTKEKIVAGSSDSAGIVRNPYWSSGEAFWLRSPYDDGYKNYAQNASVAWPNTYVFTSSVTGSRGVRPASNLNLTSVLFASFAKAATASSPLVGTAASDAAMVLRLDGSKKSIGTVEYDAASGRITAKKDTSAAGAVSLVVQGRGMVDTAEADWYYSILLTSPSGEETLTAEQIRTSVGLADRPNLDNCKIWLEITEDNVAYAKLAPSPFGSLSIISAVAVTGLTASTGGMAFNRAATCVTRGISTPSPGITYTTVLGGRDVAVTESVAEWNKAYKAQITLGTSAAYMFADTVSVTIDGEPAVPFKRNADGTLTVTKDFTTAKRKIAGITAPFVPAGFVGDYTAANVLAGGVNSELGRQAQVTFEGSVQPTSVMMDVEWSLENAGGAAYNAAPGAANTFRWTVKKDAYANYDTNKNSMSGVVVINNKEAGLYAIHVSPAEAAGGVVSGGGTYRENTFVTVTATANSGYRFVRWLEHGNEVSTQASYSFDAAANRTLVAVFEAESSVTVPDSAWMDGYEGKQKFAALLYGNALGREADSSEIGYWEDQLSDGREGAEVAYGFLFSQEFENHNYNNSDYVEHLYLCLMGRPSDAGGKAGWVTYLDNGASRIYVFKQFIDSSEFNNLCNAYGIQRGTVELTEARDQNYDVARFVARNYTQFLGRDYDEQGLNNWCAEINNRTQTMQQIAFGFVFSAECENKNLSDKEFVEMLYRGCFDRDGEAAGVSRWVNELGSGAMNRIDVFFGFANSQEFANMVQSYGL
ncbi:MAG: DUF4214 domain-containing protein [Clostridiales bacterium]|nr:DUF4214 domain-containing protein [Clostridiales bacterium]